MTEYWTYIYIYMWFSIYIYTYIYYRTDYIALQKVRKICEHVLSGHIRLLDEQKIPVLDTRSRFTGKVDKLDSSFGVWRQGHSEGALMAKNALLTPQVGSMVGPNSWSRSTPGPHPQTIKLQMQYTHQHLLKKVKVLACQPQESHQSPNFDQRHLIVLLGWSDGHLLLLQNQVLLLSFWTQVAKFEDSAHREVPIRLEVWSHPIQRVHSHWNHRPKIDVGGSALGKVAWPKWLCQFDSLSMYIHDCFKYVSNPIWRSPTDSDIMILWWNSCN